MTPNVIPFSLEDTPSLIERLLPVQKLSAEAYKEQMANVGKTLTALGSYWKGRKPLVLAKACVLGCLLPASNNPERDLEIFEKLMAMDDESFVARWKSTFKPKEILTKISISHITDYFIIEPANILPTSSPVDWTKPEYKKVKITWREDISTLDRRRLEAQMLPEVSYRERVKLSRRAEEVDNVHDHIWDGVNGHLGTNAKSLPELVEQLGIMRYGHRPQVADTFCGSGQIPFEAARLGCNVYASDLNPIASMLTWGAFNIVGGSIESRRELEIQQQELVHKVQKDIDDLVVETDGQGWRAKAFLYCLEVRCPQTNWMVPLIPSLIISQSKKAIAELIPDPINKRYDIQIRSNVSKEELKKSERGTVRTDGRGQDPYLIHFVDGIEFRTKISTIRGDFTKNDGTNSNCLRLWEKTDFMPLPYDIYKERLYVIHWMQPKKRGKGFDYEFRSVSQDDMQREHIVEDFMAEHIVEWQEKGWIPDMQIEPGYNTDQPIREKGWMYWHHLFNPRQLLVNGLINRYSNTASLKFSVNQSLNWNSKLSPWNNTPGADSVNNTFYNQALNTLFNYGARSSHYVSNQIAFECKSYPFANIKKVVSASPADSVNEQNDIYITDPPYGDAVNYDEILEFFIAWLRKNPPPEFADWVWDSRRSLAIKGQGEDFRRGMVSSYRRMTECMPDNGIQVIMFTHQSGSIWADMANIVWASGLQVTAAWYVVTETDSPIREGSYVKGTVLLVCRKRKGVDKTTRGDLAWEIQEEVETQVEALTGLNQQAKGLYRDENVFDDADIQMAGYAAALRVLTRYAIIDGRDMTSEAIRPRIKGETTFVDSLINFAVDTANQSLVPHGIPQSHWDKLTGAERFYLKMIEMEARGAKTLDNYQNFAKAFKVDDFRPLLASQKANQARLKSAIDFGRGEMGEGSELHDSVLRAVLYAIMELQIDMDGHEVLAHLILNIPDYYNDVTQRELALSLTDYLANRLEYYREDEARNARVLFELIKTQRLG